MPYGTMGDGPYPSIKQMDRLAEGGCWKRFKSFIGLGYYRSQLEFNYLTPDESVLE